MVVVKCPECGARYRVPEKLRGRKVKCKKCGKPFRIAPPPEEQEVGEDLLGALAEGEIQVSSAPPPPPPPDAFAAFPATQSAGAVVAETAERPATGIGTYLRDVGKSLLFFRHGGDLITFVIVAIVVALQVLLGFAGCLGLLGVIIINGWYMA